jgi:hypothetical protein
VQGSKLPRLLGGAVFVWIAVFAGIMYDARQVTNLRFTSDSVRHAAFLLFWFVPPWLVVVVAMWYEWPLLGEGARVGRLVVLTILTLCLTMIAVLSVFTVFTHSRVCERVTMGRNAVVLEAVTCGSTCSADLVLRQEWSLVPGLVRSRQLGDWYQRSDGHISLLSRSRDTVVVRLQAPPSSDSTIQALDTVLVISRVP